VSRAGISCGSVTVYAAHVKWVEILSSGQPEHNRHSSKAELVGYLKSLSNGQGKNKQLPLLSVKGSCCSFFQCRRHMEVWLVQTSGFF